MNLIKSGQNLFNRVQSGVQQTVDKAQSAVSTVGNAVQQTVKQGGQQVGKFVDGFEQQAAQKVELLGGLFGGNKTDKVHDGKLVGAGGQTFAPGTPLSQIPGITPKNNPNPSETVLYVNGVGNTKDTQAHSMQQIADTTGAKVIGVHNATEGHVTDLFQAVKDKLDKGTNPAVDTMADTIYSELKAGRGIHVMGHSQGGLILSRALEDVGNRLRIEDGMSQADVEKMLGQVKVETFGAAAMRYPDGPQYVHYVNDKDLVPTMFGLGDGKSPLDLLRNPGRDAVVRHYEYGSGISGTHRLDQAYLAFRVPFDEARAGRS
jgi:hypothetical protein